MSQLTLNLGVPASSADIEGPYRYHLRRRGLCDSGRTCLFVMLNPSTADASKNDPTIRRCIAYASAWGYGWLEVVNLFAYRATSPLAMMRHPEPIGPRNDQAIQRAAVDADLVVCAWGIHGVHLDRDKAIVRLLAGCDPHVLKLTDGGYPNHPLFLPANLEPQPWRVP